MTMAGFPTRSKTWSEDRDASSATAPAWSVWPTPHAGADAEPWKLRSSQPASAARPVKRRRSRRGLRHDPGNIRNCLPGEKPRVQTSLRVSP